MEIRERIVKDYEEIKASLETDVSHLKGLLVEKFVWAILLHKNKKENPKMLAQEFLAWGYAKNIFYPKSLGKKILWHLCVFLDWKNTSEKDHDMNNHMSIAGKKEVKKEDIKGAEGHVLELLGDHPGALSSEAIEDILGPQPKPAT